MEKSNKWQSTPRKGPVYSTGAPKKKARKRVKKNDRTRGV